MNYFEHIILLALDFILASYALQNPPQCQSSHVRTRYIITQQEIYFSFHCENQGA